MIAVKSRHAGVRTRRAAGRSRAAVARQGAVRTREWAVEPAARSWAPTVPACGGRGYGGGEKPKKNRQGVPGGIEPRPHLHKTTIELDAVSANSLSLTNKNSPAPKPGGAARQLGRWP